MKKDITNREDIILMVQTFYDYVQQDPALDHMFNGVAKLDWEKHLPKMHDFWEAIIFKKPGYNGNPMMVHKMLHGQYKFEKSMFITWLELFNKTVDELFEGDHAREAKTRALSIATMIQMKTIYA
tara:strand:+ start:102761 stop:103135 length:375 start_codon:yes stop_codon:yes gene_type:complete